MMKKLMFFCAAISLFGCANVTPEAAPTASNARLCATWEQNPKAEYIQKEMKARNLDCVAYMSLEANRRSAAAAGQSNYWHTYNAVTRPYGQ